MEELGDCVGDCATDQALYNLEARGIEWDLLPWCQERRTPVMAYSPMGQGGRLREHPALAAVARRHGEGNVTPAQVALAWALRQPGTIVIPKASDPAHVRANAAAREVTLSPDDLATLDVAFAPPARREPLGMLWRNPV